MIEHGESSVGNPVAGWYPDPATPNGLRWWDSEAWTTYTLPVNARPPVGPPAMPDASGRANADRAVDRPSQGVLPRGLEETRVVVNDDETRTTSTNVRVGLDSEELNSRGWQVINIQARVLSDSFDEDDYYHRVEINGTVRFSSRNWIEPYSDMTEFPPPFVIGISCNNLTDSIYFFQPFFPSSDEARGLIGFSRTERIGDTDYLDHSTVNVLVTALDAFEGIGWGMPIHPRNLPVRVVNESVSQAVQVQVDFAGIRLYTDRAADTAYANLEISGEMLPGGVADIWSEYKRQISLDENERLRDWVPFSVGVPSMSVEMYDQAGLKIGCEEISLDLQVPVLGKRRAPVRAASWKVTEGLMLEVSAERLARAIVRIHDST